jgi:rod shape-determining protein MreD
MTGRLAMMAAVLFSALLLQTVVLPGVAVAGVTPHLVLLTVLGFGLADGPGTGARYGFWAGIALDVVGTGAQLVGVSALVLLFVGHAAGAVRAYLSGTGVVGQVTLAAGASSLAVLVLGTLVTLLEISPVGLGQLLVAALVAGLYNGALAPVVLAPVGRLSRRYPGTPVPAAAPTPWPAGRA